jgi:hypothetical protein
VNGRRQLIERIHTFDIGKTKKKYANNATAVITKTVVSCFARTAPRHSTCVRVCVSMNAVSHRRSTAVSHLVMMMTMTMIMTSVTSNVSDVALFRDSAEL